MWSYHQQGEQRGRRWGWVGGGRVRWWAIEEEEEEESGCIAKRRGLVDSIDRF